MRIFVLACVSMLLFCQSFAQDDVKEAVRQINAIKADTKKYIYAEATTAKWEEAYENAKGLLEVKIEEWARTNTNSKDITGCVAKTDNSILEIKTRRGNLYRVFLYVKISDIMTYTVESDVVNVPVRHEEPQETIVVRHGEPETVSVILSGNTAGNADTADTADIADNAEYTPTGLEMDMLKVGTFEYIESFIKGRHITEYGKYSTMPSTGDFYVFIYNDKGEIPACIKYQDGKSINIATGKEDNVKSYNGCGAIWFRK